MLLHSHSLANALDPKSAVSAQIRSTENLRKKVCLYRQPLKLRKHPLILGAPFGRRIFDCAHLVILLIPVKDSIFAQFGTIGYIAELQLPTGYLCR